MQGFDFGTDLDVILRERFVSREYPKRTLLFSELNPSSLVYWIRSGTLKQYQNQGKKTFVLRLLQAGDITESSHFLLFGKTLPETLETLSPVETWEIPYKDLISLSEIHLSVANWMRETISLQYALLEKRVWLLLALQPRERYELLVREHSDWFGTFSDGTLAAYIGVSKETFSRFRNKLI